MPYNAPEWRGERYCIGCRMVSGGVDEEGLCPDCADAWAKKMVVDAAEAARVFVAAQQALPGLTDRQIKRMMRKARMIG